MKTPASQKGFSLTELLVASMLISIVLTATYTLFNGSIRTWRFMDQEYNTDQRMRIVLSLFRREAESLLPTTYYLFNGTDAEITMYTLAEPMNLEAGEGKRLLQVRYRYNPVKEELVREEALVVSNFPPLPSGADELDFKKLKLDEETEFTVAKHVAEFSIAYVWVPFPDMRDANVPPQEVTPAKFSENRALWGFPQALEVRVSLRDQEGKLKTITSTIPLRVESVYLTHDMLSYRAQQLEEK